MDRAGLADFSERFYRFRFRDLRAALLARSPRVVVPEVEHRLTEVLDDVAAVEINVFHQCPAIVAVENNVFPLSRRAATFDHDSQCVRRPHGSVRNIGRNEKRFTLAHQMIDDPIPFADAHFNVALQLVEILFRIDEMKIVPRVRALDHHHKKIAAIIKITVAHRRLEQVAVLFDPVVQINRRLHRGRGAGRRRFWFGISNGSDNAAYLRRRAASTSVNARPEFKVQWRLSPPQLLNSAREDSRLYNKIENHIWDLHPSREQLLSARR